MICLFVAQVQPPTGQRREGQRLGGGVAQAAKILPATPGGVFLRTVEPVTLDRRPLDECTRAVNARPLGDLLDQIFFDPVREYVSQSGDLGFLLVADDNGLISPGPDLVAPIHEPPELASEV